MSFVARKINFEINTEKNKELECGSMPNVMVALGIWVAPSVKNDEERVFRNSIPCTMPQSLANAHCSRAVHNAVNIGKRKTWTQGEFCT